MKIGGLQKVSLIDYPGQISSTIFLQGCNFKCPYCHNPELVDAKLFNKCLDEKEILDFLKNRIGKIDGVTVTGGEPTIQNDLMSFLKRIKRMGFAVKLDTNGSLPDVLRNLLKENLLDYIAMDIKAPLSKYENIAQVPLEINFIEESVRIILKAKIEHEFRTTVVQSLLTEGDILNIAGLIIGARRYTLQKFVPTKTLDKNYLKAKPLSADVLEQIRKKLGKEIPNVTIR
jgi:pyruvate formate lyase activating enzyme